MPLTVGKKNDTHWEINNYELVYYKKAANLFGKAKLEFKVNFEDIAHIEVYFVSKPLANAALYGVGTYAHSIIFDVLLKNGQSMDYDILTTVNREELKNEIYVLKKLQVVFVDKYKLLDVISGDNRIYEEIEKIIKGNNLMYTNKKQ